MQSKLICEHAPEWLDVLHEEIESVRRNWPDAHVYALLDCAFVERTHAAIQKHRLPSRSLYDLSDKPSRELQAVSPTLMPLTLEGESRWRDVLRLTDGWPMLSLIVTPEPLDDLAQRLSQWCVVNADGQPFVFRFPDTRRLPAVVDVLTPAQHGAFFGPALAWRYRTRSAQWAELPLPATPLPPADQVKLDAQQSAELINESEADEIMAYFSVYDPAVMRQYHPAAAHKLVMHGLKRADRYGIADADRVQWCRMVLQQPKLEQIPAAISLLVALLSQECSYADIKSELAKLARSSFHQSAP